jgi:hypothetical protein
MAYELWNYKSANVIGEWETEREARDFIDGMVRAHGRDVVRGWQLVYEDEQTEETTTIARDLALIGAGPGPTPPTGGGGPSGEIVQGAGVVRPAPPPSRTVSAPPVHRGSSVPAKPPSAR